MSDNFFNKMVYNCIRTWKPDFSEDNFLSELTMRYRGFENDWAKKFTNWVVECREKTAQAEKTGKTGEAGTANISSYVSAKHFLTEERLEEWCKEIASTNDVTSDWTMSDNTMVLKNLLDLDDVETLILELALRLSSGDYPYEWSYSMSRLVYADDMKIPVKFLARCFDIPEEKVKAALTKGFLVSSGFLVTSEAIKSAYQINDDLNEMFIDSNLTLENMESQLFPTNITTELSTDHFPHLDKEIKMISDIIDSSIAEKKKGANVMLWGLPGTGKTELALALAEKNGWKLKSIGDVSNTDTREKSRAQRLTSLKVAMKLFANSDDKVVLLFDEMEDLIKSDNNAAFSKAFINRIIETTPVPIIWTTNSLAIMDRATLRRMVYNIGFEVPPADARRVMWENYAKKYDLEFDDETLENYAQAFDTVPALISNAVMISKMAGLKGDAVTDVMTSLDRLVNYGEKRKFEFSMMKDTPYDPAFANTDIDLNVLTERLLKAKPNFSMCLYGAPGTGKSEYGRYLAKSMGKKVLFKRASDLQSMWVGECEKNIAKAFKEASDSKRVLIIDEGDSFLQDRQGAKNSWEISQVNEMLSQMENHDQPFIITTNLMDRLDPASLRRFTFKMKFNYSTPTQAKDLFRAFFGMEAPREIEFNGLLAPGDFAAIKKKVDILGITDANEIYAMLQEETALKNNGSSRIGF